MEQAWWCLWTQVPKFASKLQARKQLVPCWCRGLGGDSTNTIQGHIPHPGLPSSDGYHSLRDDNTDYPCFADLFSSLIRENYAPRTLANWSSYYKSELADERLMSSSLFSKNRKKLKEERKCKKPSLAPHPPLSYQHTHTHTRTPPIHTNSFPLACVSFYGCVFTRIQILVSVPWGNDDKYAKVSSSISHGSCSFWELQIIIYLVRLVAYTTIHASPYRWNVPYLTKTLVLLCLSGAQRNS